MGEENEARFSITSAYLRDFIYMCEIANVSSENEKSRLLDKIQCISIINYIQKNQIIFIYLKHLLDSDVYKWKGRQRTWYCILKM